MVIPPRISHPPNMEEVRKNIEFRYVFRTNSRGLRYREVPLEVTQGSYRVFVSGDSFAEGECVDEGKRFTDLLECFYSRSERTVLFINGGLAGTGPLEYGRLFLRVGMEYKPDALLICIYANDLANTPEEITRNELDTAIPSRSGIKKLVYFLWPRVYTLLKRFKLQREYRKKTRTSDFVSLVSREAKKLRISKERIEIWKASLPQELVEAVNRGEFNGSFLSPGLLYPEYWSDSIDISSDRAEKKLRNMTTILSEIVLRAKQLRVNTAIVFIPSYFQYDPQSHNAKNPWITSGTYVRKQWLSEVTEIQKRLEDWSKDQKVPFLDLTPSFREAIQSGKKTNWVLDEHLTPLGHEVAALAIASWLSDQQVFYDLDSLAIQ